MSKRIYELDVDDVSEMVGLYMRQKYPELADMPEDVNVTLTLNKRTRKMVVGIETPTQGYISALKRLAKR